MSGTWWVTVVSKESLFAQRVVISGDVQKMLGGEVGNSTSVSGRRWILGFEHDRGDGIWRHNASVEAGEIVRRGDELQRWIATKDVFWSGDRDHDDLKLLLTRPASTGQALGAPYAAEADLRELSTPWVLPSVEIPEVPHDRSRSASRTRSAGTQQRRLLR
jgi:hypothetical protein